MPWVLRWNEAGLNRTTRNVEATLGGKSDPYVRVQVRNVTKARTEVINNNLNPVWDEIVYVPVHSLRESLMLECMDYQHLTKVNIVRCITKWKLLIGPTGPFAWCC